MDKHVFYTCQTPTQAATLVPKYAKTFGITQKTVFDILWRFHGLFVDAAMVRKVSRSYPCWVSTGRRSSGVRVHSARSNADFLASYCMKSNG